MVLRPPVPQIYPQVVHTVACLITDARGRVSPPRHPGSGMPTLRPWRGCGELASGGVVRRENSGTALKVTRFRLAYQGVLHRVLEVLNPIKPDVGAASRPNRRGDAPCAARLVAGRPDRSRLTLVQPSAYRTSVDRVDQCRLSRLRQGATPSTPGHHRRPSPTAGDPREQAYVPAEQPPSRQDARLPPPHAHACRPLDPLGPSHQGPQASRGLSVSAAPVRPL